MWLVSERSWREVVAGAEIVLENIAKTSFPMTFPQFEAGAVSYELEGFPLDEVTPVDVLFGQSARELTRDARAHQFDRPQHI